MHEMVYDVFRVQSLKIVFFCSLQVVEVYSIAVCDILCLYKMRNFNIKLKK